MTTHLTTSDVETRDNVIQQLAWEAEVDAGGIGVTVSDGTVTLTGYIDSYAGKLAAERAAKLVRGVRTVANDLGVRLKMGRTDTDIATDVTSALRIRSVPEAVQGAVHQGHVTLTGHVDRLYQKRTAEDAVTHVPGVKHVANYITVASGAVTRDVQRRITQSMHHHADLDARRITIAVEGERVTLTGSTETWLQRDLAERAAASADGITEVDNRIVVDYPVKREGETIDEVC